MIFRRGPVASFGEMDDTCETLYQSDGKAGTNLKLSLDTRANRKQTLFEIDDCLNASTPVHGMQTVETADAQVPEICTNIIVLSDNMSPILDTPSIIDSFVDQDPFRFYQPGSVLREVVLGQPADIVSAAAASAMLGISDENEQFIDLSQLMHKDPALPMVCNSPEPLLSPTDSTYSNISSISSASSSVTLLSGASTSQEDRFFAPDFEVLTSEIHVKRETSSVMRRRTSKPDNRYNEMRRKNNLASRRSRLTRREKEREMELQQENMEKENKALRDEVRQLEAQVEGAKKIITQIFMNRRSETK